MGGEERSTMWGTMGGAIQRLHRRIINLHTRDTEREETGFS